MHIARISSANQWPAQNFRNQIEADMRAEVRVAATYDTPIDLVAIRAAVVSDILACALPAGNA